MDFGYFTLSDNHYENNSRSSNQFVADITAEALYAEKVGMHSAWIGEHHFNSLGVLSCPDMVLADPGRVHTELIGMERFLGDVGDELVRRPCVVLVVIVAQGEIAEFHSAPPVGSLGRGPIG